MKIHFLSFPVLFIAPLLFMISCAKESAEISVRELSEEERDLKVADSTAQRFRFSARTPSAPSGNSTAAPRLAHKTPEGWKDVPGSQMRDINLTFGKDGKGECYLTKLAGAGGGLIANVNRWRKQMGATEMTGEEIAALPKKPLFGQGASFVDVTGNFGGMSGADGKKNYRLLGVILTNQAGAVFVKMIGPKADVDANAGKFDEFISSLAVSVN